MQLTHLTESDNKGHKSLNKSRKSTTQERESRKALVIDLKPQTFQTGMIKRDRAAKGIQTK